MISLGSTDLHRDAGGGTHEALRIEPVEGLGQQGPQGFIEGASPDVQDHHERGSDPLKIRHLRVESVQRVFEQVVQGVTPDLEKEVGGMLEFYVRP